jgi:hypothetical protein
LDHVIDRSTAIFGGRSLAQARVDRAGRDREIDRVKNLSSKIELVPERVRLDFDERSTRNA